MELSLFVIRIVSFCPASICNLPHVAGVGCIKCTGLVSAELAGRLTTPVAKAEASSESLGPKHLVGDTCGACESGAAQHPVGRYHEGAQLPSPSVQEAHRSSVAAEYPKSTVSSSAALPDKDHVVPEPGKDKPFYGTEWAGRTGQSTATVEQRESAMCVRSSRRLIHARSVFLSC